MTLLSILVGLGLEYFLGTLDRIRNFVWFEKYSNWLEQRCNKLALWDGPVGVLITLGIPLLILALIANFLGNISIIFSFILAVIVFIYSIGSDVNSLLNNYIEALESDDEGSIRGIERQLEQVNDEEEDNSLDIIHSVLMRVHDHIFAVIFWFIVLGAVGALLFSLTVRLKKIFNDIHGSYADAVRNLYNVLIWPTARLMALGFALAGSLVDALEGWRDVSGSSIDSSEDVIRKTGLGAIQYQKRESQNEQEQRAVFVDHMQEIQTLANRTLIIWLTILGLMTISGTLS